MNITTVSCSLCRIPVMAYVNIATVPGGKVRGYISSMAFGNDRYGAALYGFEGNLWYL